jgi:hypothetical protein
MFWHMVDESQKEKKNSKFEIDVDTYKKKKKKDRKKAKKAKRKEERTFHGKNLHKSTQVFIDKYTHTHPPLFVT